MGYSGVGSDSYVAFKRYPLGKVLLGDKGDILCSLDLYRSEISAGPIDRIRNAISIRCSGSINSRLDIIVGQDLNKDELTLDVIYIENGEQYRYNRTDQKDKRLRSVIDCGYLCRRLSTLFKTLNKIDELFNENRIFGKSMSKAISTTFEIIEKSLNDERYKVVIRELKRGDIY